MDNKYWPQTILGPNIGWAMNMKDNLLKFEPERGPAKTRRLRSARIMELSTTLMLDDSQLTAFMNWHHDDLADGSLAFIYDDFVTDEQVTAKIISWSSKQVKPGEHEASLKLEVYL
ncbi:hypothetical protein [uncultured Sphaerochaeta sp.]|uniref:hypothetical protein n=1 Tax=uncultured Sphaerochaeta sp. TaxID=886478 RepID=UPI0029C9D41C|nr:hypothetical protein [uncultured Sphaerochaeta sp.]